MPQAMPIPSSSITRDGKKRREFEAALSPRASPPTRASVPSHERLPSIRNLLSDIPPQHEQHIPQQRTLRQDATGPRTALPPRFSPPPASRRSLDHSFSEPTKGYSNSSREIRRTSPSHSNIDGPYHRLPLHSGPPPGRPTYSPSTLGPAPVSPYAASSQETRRGYSGSVSQSLPPPPAPYLNGSGSHSQAYPRREDHRNGDVGHGGSHYRDARNAGPLPSIQPPYASYPTSPYGYPPPPPSANGHYSPQHSQYSNGYHHGSLHFESDDANGQTPRRRRGNLPRGTTDILKAWCSEHLGHPYPTEEEKQMLCRRTGLQMTQISNWFINARRRRIPELVNQATAETRLRENSGESAGSSD